MAETPIVFVSRGAGRASIFHAKNRLRKLGVAETGECSIASFEEEAARIVVPERCMLLANSDEFREAAAMLSTLVDAYAGTDFQVHGRLDGSSNSMEEDERGSTSAIPTPSPREPPAASTTTAGPRLGMSEEDLSRACTAMEIRGHRETPRFLADKPLDVRMYTPELVALYTCSREVTSMMGKLAAELIKFEGDFLELSPPDFERADEGANICNPCFTPLTS